jgi:putative hydrolase of the HAD superfamily
LPAQSLKVSALGIEPYFKHIVYTEQLGRQFWKPNPKGFEIILEKLSAKAQNTVYIADNAKKDFIGPNGLGMHTIQLKRPKKVHLSAPPDENATPNLITDSIILIPEILKKL